MNLTKYTISTIVPFFSGDGGLTPYLTGRKIVELFNTVGCRDIYQDGMPEGLSRSAYIQQRLNELNNSSKLVTLVHKLFDTRHFDQDTLNQIDLAVIKFNECIANDGYRLESIDGVYKIIGADPPEEVEVEIHFEDIERQILEQLNNAKFSIWVAVAWFTNKKLATALLNKRKEGLSVRLLVLDDEINIKHGFQYEEICETKRVKKEGFYENIMHHKFCVIDLKTVIHGSYNWTKKANWNKETVTIDTGREIAEKFASQFISLFK